MSDQITFTTEELKQLSKTSPLTIADLSKLISIKTDDKYSVIPNTMVIDLNTQLLSNILYINRLNDFFYKNWAELIKVNHDVTNKWKEELKYFSSKN